MYIYFVNELKQIKVHLIHFYMFVCLINYIKRILINTNPFILFII